MKDVEFLKSNGVDVDKSLELLGDMDMYNEIMHDFLDMVDNKIELLQKYKSNNDMKNYSIEVHSLKSDVRYLGFMDLGNLAYDLELKSKANDIDGVNFEHDKLIQDTNKMINLCKTYLYGESSQDNKTDERYEALDNKDMNSLDPMSQALIYQDKNDVIMIESEEPKKGVILIVDDSEIVANFVKNVFYENYDVVIASDGQKAIELVSNEEFRNKIKACLLDLNMPNVNGLDVLENFKQNNYFVKLPVAVISGVEDTELLQKAKEYPIIEVLQKPFNERDIKYCVEKCLALYF